MITALADGVTDGEGFDDALRVFFGVGFGVVEDVGNGVGDAASGVARASGVTDGNGVGTATTLPFPMK